MTPKRVVDLLVGTALLILLSPVLLLTALSVWLKFGRPILFRQQRPGLQGQPFTLLKFRTMTDARDAQGNLLLDAERLTAFGQFLRRTSLDELPELWNVIRGEMSLVGPRSLLTRYLGRYTPEQSRRHEVLPGITGWAQVNGRNTIGWDERFVMDMWYVDNLSIWLDIRIMATIVLKVLLHEATVEDGEVADFLGTQGPPPGGRLAYPAEQDETHLLERSRHRAIAPPIERPVR